MRLVLEDLNLAAAERRMVLDALEAAGSVQGAAEALKITRHALVRRMIKLKIEWSAPPHEPLPLERTLAHRRRIEITPRIQCTPRLLARLDRFCETLSDRERELVRTRILGVEPALSLREFGKRWGISAERVRNLEFRLCARLGAFALRELGSDEDAAT